MCVPSMKHSAILSLAHSAILSLARQQLSAILSLVYRWRGNQRFIAGASISDVSLAYRSAIYRWRIACSISRWFNRCRQMCTISYSIVSHFMVCLILYIILFCIRIHFQMCSIIFKCIYKSQLKHNTSRH